MEKKDTNPKESRILKSTYKRLTGYKQPDGNLEVIRVTGKDKEGNIRVVCSCSCGYGNCFKVWSGRWSQVRGQRVKGCKTYKGNSLSDRFSEGGQHNRGSLSYCKGIIRKSKEHADKSGHYPIDTTPEYLQGLIKTCVTCSICGIHQFDHMKKCNKSLYVDHDHNKEKDNVRGILCGDCNTAIGLLRDSPILLAKAKRYLK